MNELIIDQSDPIQPQAENRRPTKVEQISGLFGLLRSVCKYDPRIVIRALANPEKLRDAKDEVSVKAEGLNCEFSGKNKAREQFVKEGFQDPDKGIAVVEFFRSNLKTREYRPKNGEGNDYDKPFDKGYQFNPYDSRAIQKLCEVSDDPIALLQYLGQVVDYGNLDRYHLGTLAEYAESVANNPRARQIAEALGRLNGRKKMDISDCKVWEVEGRKKLCHVDGKERIVEPFQSLLDLPQGEFEELAKPENIDQAMKLWQDTSDNHRMRVDFLPSMLKLAHNPRLEKGFREMVLGGPYNGSGFRADHLLHYPTRLIQGVARLESLNRDLPELWDLYEDGFDVSWGFHFNDRSTTDSANPKVFVENHQASFKAVCANDSLRQNARVLAKYGRKMPLSADGYDFKDYVRKSDPDRLEKSLLITQLTGTTLTRDQDGGDGALSRYYLWQDIGDSLKDFSLEEVREVFKPLSEISDDLKSSKLNVITVIGQEKITIEEMKGRVQTLLRPEVRQMGLDRAFVSIVLQNNNNQGEQWDTILRNPDEWLSIYKKREIIAQRQKLLTSDGFCVRSNSDLLTLKILATIPNDEILRLREELNNPLATFNSQTVEIFKTLSGVNDDDRQRLVSELKRVGVEIPSLYCQNVISANDLREYFGLKDTGRQCVWQFAHQLNQDAEFSVQMEDNRGNRKVSLGFLCELASNESYGQRLFLLIDHQADSYANPQLHYGRNKAKTSGINAYIELLTRHRGEADFNIDSYVNEKGVPTQKWLDELISGADESSGRDTIRNRNKENIFREATWMITKDALESMGDEGEKFWGFWKKHDADVLHDYLIKQRSNFDLLVVNGVATELLLENLVSDRLRVGDRLITSLISDEALAGMTAEGKVFWDFWRQHDEDELHGFILERREEINTYVVNGSASEHLLTELSTSQTVELDTLASLVTEQALEQMPEETQKYWRYWKGAKGYLKKVLIGKKEIFNTLVDDHKATSALVGLIAKEQPQSFLADYNLDASTFNNAEKREIRASLIIGIQNDKDMCARHFNDVYDALSQDLAENGNLSNSFIAPFAVAYGFELSVEYIQTLARFHDQSNDPKYDALIPDRASYWEQNGVLSAHMMSAGWKLTDFDRFRSLVQNPQTNQILSQVRPAYLHQLGATIGLNSQNVFYTTKSSLDWLQANLEQDGYARFFKRMLNTKPTSFNSCVTTFQTISGEDVARIMTNPLYTERLLEAMEEFRNITPSLVRGYILEADELSRENHRDRVKAFRKNVHRNVPLMDLTSGSSGIDFMAEMICLTFPSTDVNSVRLELARVGDHCDDISGMHFRESGYRGSIASKEKVAELRSADKPVDEGVVNLVKVIFRNEQTSDYIASGGDTAMALKGWTRLLTEAGATKTEDLFTSSLQEVIACLRVSLGDKIDQYTEKMTGDTSQVADKNNLLSKAKELFGVYYKDNAGEAVAKFLDENPMVSDRLLSMLTEKKLATLEKNIGGSRIMREEEKASFASIISGLRENKSVVEKRQHLAKLLAFMTERTMFSGSKGLRKRVETELGKVVLRDKAGQEVDPTLILTGYVTKNAASYFAKTTAGVCTAHDIELYHRPDHFHVNLVNNQGIVVGNIQGYQTTVDNQPTLIFRGFNPSSSIISSTNTAVLCDQMVDMVMQIAADNGISQVMIPEQDSWHPLTNRVGEGVDKYLALRFYKPEARISHSFQISSSKTVHTFYLI